VKRRSRGRRNWGYSPKLRADEAAERNPGLDVIDAKLKPVLAREMEVYAGFMEHTDHQVGRLIDALKDLEVLDDTLIYVIIGDNGASAEGGLHGTFNEWIYLNGVEGSRRPSS